MPIPVLAFLILTTLIIFLTTIEEIGNIMKIILSIIFFGSILYICIGAMMSGRFEYKYIDTLQIIKGENGKKILVGVYENKIINLTEKGIYIENPDKYNLKVIKELSSGGINWLIEDKFDIERKN